MEGEAAQEPRAGRVATLRVPLMGWGVETPELRKDMEKMVYRAGHGGNVLREAQDAGSLAACSSGLLDCTLGARKTLLIHSFIQIGDRG